LPTAYRWLSAKETAAVLTAQFPSPTEHVAVGEATPTDQTCLSGKRPLPTTTSPTGLCRQDKRNPVGKAFADRIKAFADSFKLSAKRAFPVVADAY
jgi:hypothetical protein